MTASLDRIRWLSARTANASQRALLMAAIGALVVVVALLTFVLVPRRADRQLAAALAALPPLRDTATLRAQRDDAMRLVDSAVAQLAAMRAQPMALPTAAADADSLNDSAGNTGATAALEQLIARVRQAPLVESYRALVASPVLRAKTAVRAALDTMEALNREREASAALGGPDARYAMLTARLTALGQRLERLAEVELVRQRSWRARADSATPPLADTNTSPWRAESPVPDSVFDAVVAQARTARARADSALVGARAVNVALMRQRAGLRATAHAPIPPLAMLLAALVLGLVTGFAVVLVRELRRPTVSTADELVAMTGARVLPHDADAKPAGSLSPHPWATLHYALTPLDDVATHVTVLADRPVLVEAVRRGLAAVAPELTVSGATSARRVATDAEVVLVVQRGRTPLTWLAEVVHALRVEPHRIRAVVLWTGQLPLER